MPELPEVETTRRGIEPHITGRTVKAVTLRQPQLRWPVPLELPQLLQGRKLVQVKRRGKYLLLEFSHGHALLHLGMSGSLRIVSTDSPPQKHDHVDIVFNGGVVLRLTDPRRFGALLWAPESEHHPLLVRLGLEPLSGDFDGEYLFRRSRGRRQAIKTFIMDSSIVVGVGNIYANESLFAAGIRPSRAAASLSRARYESLVKHIKAILCKAIQQGGTTLRDFVGGDGRPGYFRQELMVYGRGGKPCLSCDKPLKEARLAQRSTVYCTSCQN